MYFYDIILPIIISKHRQRTVAFKECADVLKNKVKITIDGKTFTLMGQESEEHMQDVASYIDTKMQEIRQNSKAVANDTSLAYVLTSINVADEYFKNLEHNFALQKMIEILRSEILTQKECMEDMEKEIEQLERENHKLQRKLEEYLAEELARNEGKHTAKARPRK